MTIAVLAACSRCATENASSTNRSPSAASFLANAVIVLFFFRMEAGVFQAQDIAVLHPGDGGFRFRADAVFGESHRPLDDARDFGGDGLQRILRIKPLRPVEMRQQDHLAALVGELGDGRDDLLDAGGVGDLAVLHRHVEVDAQQDALAFDVGVVEAAEGVHGRHDAKACEAMTFRRACPSRPRCRPCDWRSPTRCHTTTSRAPACRPSPWSGPCGKRDECGSWLKSLETLGSSV